MSINSQTKEATARVLVVDDDPNATTATLRLLKSANYDAEAVNESRLALAAVHRMRPDIILCDVSMPEMDGYEVLRMLKRDPQTAVIPFIFLSGRSDHADVRHGMGLGADDYLTKPFESHELFASIEARIERQQMIAQKLETLRQSLVRSVPHEFFTPLNVILGFSMVVLDSLRAAEEINPQDLRDTMESINDAGDQLHRIACNYVLYTELSAKASSEQPEGPPPQTTLSETDLGRMVRKCGMAARRMPDVHYSFAPATVRAKAEDVEKLILELLGNALKFSLAGEWISVTGVIDESEYLIRVVDHGPGMSDEAIAEVEAGTGAGGQLRGPTHSGLGLIISGLLARRHGGSLKIARNTDRGLVVAVRLPLAPAS
ncbi:MAG: hybrid sensor histidine kinase/response regulator [Opitutaceae bacterium]